MKDTAQKGLIVQVAAEKFRRFGIRRVTMDDIARDLRLSKKSLYVHFPGKEDLVRACMEGVRAAVIPTMLALIDGPAPAHERLLGVLGVLGEISKRVSNEMLVDLKAEYPHLWQEVDDSRKAVVTQLDRLFEAGRAAGDIHPEIHATVMRDIVLAIVNNVMIPDAFAEGGFGPQDAVRTITTLMTKGLFSHPLPPQPLERKKGK